MFEDLLHEQNLHWEIKPYFTGTKRSCFNRLLDYVETGQVVAVTGVRRAGKSTLVKQLIQHLIEVEEVAPNQILFLNLEHPYLSPYREDPTTLQKIYDDYHKLMQPEGEIYVCLDEVQFVKDWPVFVKAHHETRAIRFVITGSNAAMLSSDMVTLLSGRSIPLEVFPFSFREVANIRKARSKAALRNLLEECLEFGSYPTVIANRQTNSAFDILGAHARTVLLQDVAPRLGLRKPTSLEQLYVYLVSNIGKLFSYSGLSKLFDLSDKSIQEYVRALSDSHLIYELERFSYSLKKQIRSQKKVYAIDSGQANAMGFRFSANRGRSLENMLFIDLKRLGFDTYYYKTQADQEIDFVIKDGTELALVQAAWEINATATRERELSALRTAMKELNCSKGTLIVAEPTPPQNEEKDIQILPAYKYLSSNPAERRALLQ